MELTLAFGNRIADKISVNAIYANIMFPILLLLFEFIVNRKFFISNELLSRGERKILSLDVYTSECIINPNEMGA